MTRLVLLSKPLWICLERKNPKTDIRKIVEIYGFPVYLTPNIKLQARQIESYISLLCATSKWLQDGNGYDNSVFRSEATSEIYEQEDPVMQEYITKARREKDLKWYLVDTNKELDMHTQGMTGCGKYIGSRKLWQKLLEYGAIVYFSQNNLNK